MLYSMETWSVCPSGKVATFSTRSMSKGATKLETSDALTILMLCDGDFSLLMGRKGWKSIKTAVPHAAWCNMLTVQ